MRLILVRHGETEWVRMKKYQGSTDVPLNKQGLLQAKAAARLLKKERPLVVYSSQMKRAHETARVIAASCKKEVVVDHRLKEVCFGRWEGQSHAGIRARFPKDCDQWYRANWSSCPPGGESLKSLKKRISDFLIDLRKNPADGTYVIVSHGCPIRMFLISLLNMSPNIFWNIRVDAASISIVNIKEKRNEISVLNHQHHLNELTQIYQ